MSKYFSVLVLFFFIVHFNCSSGKETSNSGDNLKITPSGLKYVVLKAGTGNKPEYGDIVVIHYTGWFSSGKKFDSSYDRGEPLIFKVGTGKVIAGWDEGILSMKTGGKRKLTIPPKLAYGKRGFPGRIPPDATLIFELELLEVKK